MSNTQKLLAKLKTQRDAESLNLAVNRAELNDVNVNDISHCRMLHTLINQGKGRMEVLTSVIFELTLMD